MCHRQVFVLVCALCPMWSTVNVLKTEFAGNSTRLRARVIFCHESRLSLGLICYFGGIYAKAVCWLDCIPDFWTFYSCDSRYHGDHKFFRVFSWCFFACNHLNREVSMFCRTQYLKPNLVLPLRTLFIKKYINDITCSNA